VTESESTIIIIEAKVAPHTQPININTVNETDNAPTVTVMLRAYAIDVSLSILQYFLLCFLFRSWCQHTPGQLSKSSKGVRRVSCTTLPRNLINKTFPRVTSSPHTLVTSDVVP
jgi:hypothetical protein